VDGVVFTAPLPTIVMFKACVICVNVAVTFLSLLIMILSGFVLPDRSSDHPVNSQPVEGSALSDTLEPSAKGPVDGVVFTVPLPTIVMFIL
jgi:hypothetical protein